MEFSDEELAGLSEQERAALAEDDESSAALADDKGADAAGGETAPAEAKPEDAPTPPAESGSSAEADDSADDGGVSEPAPAPAPAPAQQPASQSHTYKVDLPPDIHAVQDQINAKLDELDKKWEDGEIEHAEYMRQTREVQRVEAHLQAQLQRAQIAAEMASQAWEKDAGQFISDNPVYGEKPVLFDALDASIRRIASDPANAGKPNYWILQEADRQVKDAFGLAHPAKQTAAPAIPAKPQPSKKPDIPRTLGDMPAAAPQDEDPFASLDSLNGLDLEARLEKMGEAEMGKYLGR